MSATPCAVFFPSPPTLSTLVLRRRATARSLLLMTDAHLDVQPTSLKPFLTLPQLFSLTWLAYPVLSLLFVAFRLQISSADAQNAVADAKGSLLTSCKAAETAATGAASLPRFLAQGTNAQIVDAVNGTLNAARATLIIALTIMEAIIEFIVDMYRSTFLCFLELVVRGGLSILIAASEEITKFLQNTLGAVANSIRNDVSAANNAINKAIDAINKVGSIFGGDIKIPQVTLPSLDALENIKIPNDFTNALISLNSTLPTLDELRDAIDKVIEVPFEGLKREINETFSTIHFDASVLPVPQQNTLSFCADLDTSVVDRLGVDLLQVTKIATILLIVLALLLIAANCLVEWYKYRCLQASLERTRLAWTTNPTVAHGSGAGTPTVRLTDYNLMELLAASQHPLLTHIANRLSAIFRLSVSQHIHVRWFFSYVFHPPALACLLIGLFGLISVELQIAALGPIARRYEGEVASTVADFTSNIAASINDSMRNESTAYAAAVNGQVDGIQSTVNDGMFGWVNGTTSTLNDTLVTFYAEVQNTVETVFGGTILEGPVQEFVRCLLGTKVQAFENALTFLHDNLHIDVPRVNDDVLMMNQATVDEVTRPISLAAVGDQSKEGDDGGLVGRLITRYVAALKKERIMFLIFLGLWGFVVLIALGIIAWHSYGRPLLEQRRKRRWEREARTFNREGSPWLRDSEGASVHSDAPSHSPLNPTRKPVPPVDTKLGYSNAKRRNISWDSFIDAPASSEDKRRSTGRKLGKFRRGERLDVQLVPDGYEHANEKSGSGPGDDDLPPSGWWTRLTGIFRPKHSSDSGDEDWIAPPTSTPPPAPRPNLSVDTRVAPAMVSRSPSAYPGLPPTPKLGSLPPRVPPKTVTGVEQMRFPAPPSTTPVPLHHAFARQVPADTPRSPTDFMTHSRGSSFPTSPPVQSFASFTNMAGVGAMGGSSPPDNGRFLTASHGQHARKSSQSLDPGFKPTNPFATPFDDPVVTPFSDAAAAQRRDSANGQNPFLNPGRAT